MSEELKGCPFCGSDARSIDNTSDVPTWAQCNNHGRKKKGDVRCVMSHTIIPITAWNRRVPLPAEQPSNPVADLMWSAGTDEINRGGYCECHNPKKVDVEAIYKAMESARIVGQQTKGGGK